VARLTPWNFSNTTWDMVAAGNADLLGGCGGATCGLPPYLVWVGIYFSRVPATSLHLVE
jgi:hypothetical protein